MQRLMPLSIVAFRVLGNQLRTPVRRSLLADVLTSDIGSIKRLIDRPNGNNC